jgi:hypothetical protein
MFTALKNGNSLAGGQCSGPARRMFMAALTSRSCETAIRTFPRPYSKILDTSRPQRGHSATRRTDWGTPALVNINIDRLPSGSLVSQHVPKTRPTRIKRGLRHARLSKFGRAYVADRYQSVLTNNPDRLFVRVMAPRIGNLGLKGPDAILVSSALGISQSGFVMPVMLQSRNSMAIAKRGKFPVARIDANFAHPGLQVIGNLAGKGKYQRPCASCTKAPALNRPSISRLFQKR